jgi:hypothetical protein
MVAGFVLDNRNCRVSRVLRQVNHKISKSTEVPCVSSMSTRPFPIDNGVFEEEKWTGVSILNSKADEDQGATLQFLTSES